MKTFDGFLKRKLGDTNVLLAGGDHKALSDFIGSISYDSSTRKIKYTPVGGSATDLVTFGTLAFDSTGYLPLTGGTMNDKAVIARSCASVSWYKGRLYPIIKTTSYTGYNSILSMKTTNGSWDLGVYTNDTAYLTFITDTDYNAGTNNRTYQLTFPKSTGTLALTSLIPTKASWNYDDIYISSLTTSGNYLRWVKNGTNNDITIPYATNADTVDGEHASAFAHIGAHNNLTASGNEFTTASSGFSGVYYWNYRTAGGTNGNITQYSFCDGKGGTLAYITSGTFNGNCTGSAGSVAWGNVTGKPSTFSPSSHTHGFNQITDGTSASTSSGWSHILSNTYGGSLKSILYMCHGGGYGMHLRGYSTSASVYMLEIYNTSSQVFAVYGDGHAVHGGNVTAPNYYSSSDINKKYNIKRICPILPLYSFNWKESKEKSYGFIAQYLEDLGYTELVNGEEGNKSVNYSAALSWAMAILSNVVDDLRGRIIQLENKLSKYENL